ncbi:MAG TPA: ferritin-like domain-containing protein [Myxococcaceae bacterium]|nr:ferritin-like domain-containing protein [Myxococcaceae bacterium]
MIESREHLIHVLTEAAEIEHNLLCSYLYAAFSLKRRGEDRLSERQADAVERWRKVVLKISLEEMAHLACVNNLLVAVGGAPHFDRPNLPLSPGYHPADVVVRLTPFDEATLDHFIFLERPEDLPLPDGEGFEPEGVERVVQPGRLTPSAADYQTVGALYDSVAKGFQRLARRLGETVLIDPGGCSQLDSEVIGLPDIPRVTDLATALGAIKQIKEQGEGSHHDHTDSHFIRFQAIKSEWRALKDEDPTFTPAWPAAHDPVMRKPADEKARVWVTEPQAAAHLDLANAIYGTMLSLLAQTFAAPLPPPELRVLMRASVELMEASAAVATALARLPASPDHPGVNAGMTFAVPRNASYRPARAKTRQLFIERVRELRDGADRVLQGETAEKARRRLGNALAMLEGTMAPE